MRKVLLAQALALALLLPLSANAADYRPDVAAHRGASGYLPEHTLPAKAMAYAMGVDYVEQDVVMTKDGKLMVMHDILVDTTTDVAKNSPIATARTAATTPPTSPSTNCVPCA